MERRRYTSGRFARKAAVSIRTLRYYDQVGLLSPSDRSDAGYRLYTDDDMATLQQIVALKFLGFSLDEIRACRLTGPRRLPEALAQQKAMLRERRAHVDTIIRAIERAEELLRTDQGSWEPIVQMMEAIQVEQKQDWVHKYFTEEQRAKMRELSDTAYTDEARQKLAGRGPWTEADQQRADERWGWVNAELRRLTSAGADPAGQEAQAWAKARNDLLHEFTQGDPEIESGLQRWWETFQSLPESERPPMPMESSSPEEQAFMAKVMAVYKTE